MSVHKAQLSRNSTIFDKHPKYCVILEHPVDSRGMINSYLCADGMDKHVADLLVDVLEIHADRTWRVKEDASEDVRCDTSRVDAK